MREQHPSAVRGISVSQRNAGKHPQEGSLKRVLKQQRQIIVFPSKACGQPAFAQPSRMNALMVITHNVMHAGMPDK